MRGRQPLPFNSFNPPLLEKLELNERGLGQRRVVDYSRIKLPSVETTDLRALIDAGVNLKEVDSRIYGIRDFVTDMSTEESEQTNIGEMENE